MDLFGRARIAELERIGVADRQLIVRRDETLGTASETITALRLEIESLREAAYGADRTAAMYKKLYEGATTALRGIADMHDARGDIGASIRRLAHTRAETPPVRADVGALVAALRRFVRHDMLCGIVGGYGYCTCGLVEAKQALIDIGLGGEKG
jgi:hypothetical protein